MARAPLPILKVTPTSLQNIAGDPPPGSFGALKKGVADLAAGKKITFEADNNPTGKIIPTTTMTASQVEDVKELISDEENYIRNPLNDFDGVTYNWTMYMTNDLDTAKSLNAGNSIDISPEKVISALDNQRKIIIAESGVTVGFNIQDVRLEQVVGPSFQNRNTNTTRITMTIVEPLGTSFLEKIKNAALDLGIRNLNKVFYYLELSFKGYDTEGNPQNPAAKMGDVDIPNGGRWIYQIQITDIQTQLDTSGSTYSLTCIPFSEGAYSEEIMRASKNHTIEGRTIGEMLDSLAVSMKEGFDSIYGDGYLEVSFVTHPIRHSLFQDEDPKDWSVVPSLIESESMRGISFKGVNTAKVDLGMPISDVIEFIFANTEKAQQIAKDVARNNDVDEGSEKSTMTRFREAVIFRIEPDVDIVGYHNFYGNYKRKVTFHIWAYATQSPIISYRQEQDAQNPAVQVQMVNELRNKGFLRKRYDYYFTGMNTEVIRLDVKYNLAWTAVLPVVMGHRATIEAASDGSKITRDDVAAKKTNLAELNSEIAKLDDELNGTSSRAGLGDRAQELENAGRSEEARALRERVVEARAELEEKRKLLPRAQEEFNRTINRFETESDERFRINLPESQYKDYAEDLRDVATPDGLPLQISFSHKDTQSVTGTGTTPLKSGDRGLYGAILEQLYGPLTSGLITVELEIRGDPYWLGYSNLERKSHMSNGPPDLTPNAALPNNQEGDCVFLLNFDFPFEIDPETGGPTIRENENGERLDTFNGMYRTIRVVHNFDGGQFTSTIHGSRLPLIDLARIMGYTGGVDSVESVPAASPNAVQGTPRRNATSGPVSPTTAPVIGNSIRQRAASDVSAAMRNPNTKAIADQIVSGAKGRGYSHTEAIGVLANGLAESNLNPKAVNTNGERSYGIFQLNANGGVGTGKPVSEMLTVSGNLGFILDEADSRNFGGMDNSSPAKAAVNFMREIERPSDRSPTGPNAQKRAAIAEELARYYPNQ